jgi:hypothetical protein
MFVLDESGGIPQGVMVTAEKNVDPFRNRKPPVDPAALIVTNARLQSSRSGGARRAGTGTFRT